MFSVASSDGIVGYVMEGLRPSGYDGKQEDIWPHPSVFYLSIAAFKHGVCNDISGQV